MLITTAVLSALGGKKSKSSSSAAYIEAGILDSSGNTDTALYNPNGVRHNNKLKSFFHSHYFKLTRQISVSIAAFFVFFITVFSISGAFVGGDLVSANDDMVQWEEESEEAYQDALSDGQEGLSPEDIDDPERMRETMSSEGQGWEHLLYRIAGSSNYLNDTREAVDPALGFLGASNTPNKICIEPDDQHVAFHESGGESIRLGPNSAHSPDPNLRDGTNPPYYHEGVPHYHNCDIPNMMTEFYQFVASVFAEQGMSNAELTSSYQNLGIGLPENDVLPEGNVPERPEDRDAKYTAFEVFGYNLNYTMYQGEWDHIGALSEARMTANFGVLDHLTVVAHGVWNAVTAFAGSFVDGVVDGWESGENILTKSAGAFVGMFRGAADGVNSAMQSGVRTVLDTGDYNVQRTYGWYRHHYPETAYGMRQLSQEEMQTVQIELMQNALSQALTQFVDGWQEGGTPPNYESILPGSMPSFDSTEALSVSGDADRTLARYWDIEANGEAWYNNIGLGDEYADYADEEEEFGWSDLQPLRAPAIEETVEDNRSDLMDFLWEEHLDRAWFQRIDVDFDEDLYGFNYSGFEQCISDNSSYSENAPALLEGCWSEEYNATTEAQQEAMQELAEAELEDDVVNSIFEQFMSRPIGHPASRFVCTDELGRDVLDSDGNVQYVYPNHNSIAVNDDCPMNMPRPPIQGALFGDGYIDYDAPTDTRRERFEAGDQILTSWVNSIMNGAANFQLGVTTTLAQWSNFLIELSFSPVLQSLGLDEVIATMIESFRDSLFFPLSVLLVIIAGIVILWRVIANRQYREGWFSILMVVFIFFSGIFVMDNPQRLVDLSDEIPSNVENALAAAVFTTGSEESDNICSATGGAFDPEAYETTETIEGTEFNTNVVIRSMMCETWRVFAFSPWSHGQFGTSYNNLFANGHSGQNNSTSMQNTNEELVGDASVDLGGANGTVNNWAIYQLNAVTSGTTTTQDTIRAVGYTDPDMYRLVDLQAGPNNAERSDTRYFDYWSGGNLFDRISTSFMSTIVSIFGIITIFLYVILKLEYTMMMTLLLLALPIMFLFGLEPSNGKGKLREYFATLLTLMFKRVMVVVMLAMFLRILSSAETASALSGYFPLAIMVILICIVFIMFRKQFMKMIDEAGQKMGNTNFAGAGQEGGIVNKIVPQRMQRTAQRFVSGAVGGGAVGAVVGASSGYKTSRTQGKGVLSSVVGGATGSAGGALNHGTKAARVQAQQALRSQRRHGFGIGANLMDTSMAVRRELNQKTKGAEDEATLEAKRTFALSQYRSEKQALEGEKENLDKIIDESYMFNKNGTVVDGLSKSDEQKAYRILRDRRHAKRNISELEGKIDVVLNGNVSANTFNDLYRDRSESELTSINRGINKVAEDIRSGVVVDDRDHQQKDSERVRSKVAELDQLKRRIEDRKEMDDDEDITTFVSEHSRYNTEERPSDLHEASAEEQEKHIMEDYEQRGFGVSRSTGVDEHSAERRFKVIDSATGNEVEFRYNKAKDMWGALAASNEGDIFWKKTAQSRDVGSLIDEANIELSDKALESHQEDAALETDDETRQDQIMSEISSMVDVSEEEKEAIRKLSYGRDTDHQAGDTLKAMKAVIKASSNKYVNEGQRSLWGEPSAMDDQKVQDLTEEAKELIKKDISDTFEEVLYRRNAVSQAHTTASKSKTVRESRKKTRAAESQLAGERFPGRVHRGTKKVVSESSRISDNDKDSMNARQRAREQRQSDQENGDEQ